MNLLRLPSRKSKKLVMQDVVPDEQVDCRIRPLPSQQEEAMKAKKTLFGYLLKSRRVSQIPFIPRTIYSSAVSGNAHFSSRTSNETSADEAQVVCYCVSIIEYKPDRFFTDSNVGGWMGQDELSGVCSRRVQQGKLK